MDQLTCPWSNMQPSTLQWCERQLCEWIREPANTWSNLSYIIIGILIVIMARKQKASHLVLVGVFSMLIGLMSGFYHASNSFFGEVLDFSSMFLVSTYIVCANLARYYGWTARRLSIVAFALVFSAIGLLWIYESIGIELFAIQLIIALVMEFRLIKSPLPKANYKPLIYSLGFFGLAYISWWLDKEKIVCDPDRHWISGHAIWHFLTAVAIIFIYHFYSQFKIKENH